MQPGLSDVANDVEADPGAVFDFHGAESVDELVAADERDASPGADAPAASDATVDGLFDGRLDEPDPEEPTASEPEVETRSAPEVDGAILDELEGAIAATDGGRPEESAAAVFDTVTDAEVRDALSAAEDLAAEDLPEDVPAEWLED